MVITTRYGATMKVGDLVRHWQYVDNGKRIGIVLEVYSDELIEVMWGNSDTSRLCHTLVLQKVKA